MKEISSIFKKEQSHELILMVFFIIYLVGFFSIPKSVAELIDTKIGIISVSLICVGIFMNVNPFLGILSIFIAYKLINDSRKVTGSKALSDYYPSEETKWTPFSSRHQFPYTLEQEIVKQMTDQKYNDTYIKTEWRPKINNTYNAEFLQ